MKLVSSILMSKYVFYVFYVRKDSKKIFTKRLIIGASHKIQFQIKCARSVHRRDILHVYIGDNYLKGLYKLKFPFLRKNPTQSQ